MSEDKADVTAEAPAEETAAEAAEEAVEETDAAAADEVAETAEETPAPVADAPGEDADAPAEEPVAEEERADEPVAEEPADETAEADEPATPTEAFGPVRVARVYVCERAHRTTTLWGEPDTCQARPFRNGPACGLKLYHITELPEQVQKALNPLKASKKASKKK